AIGSWLYKVAYRAALSARQSSTERAAREQVADCAWLAAEAHCRETVNLDEAIREEVSHLPEKFRLPLILFHFEGRSLHEVARELGCPCGTAGSRLARARDRLRRRLLGRGLAMPGAALAADGMGAPPTTVIQQTIRAALVPGLPTETVSIRVLSLT